VAANLAANLAFMIGRRAGRDRFEHWLLKHPKLLALERAVGRDAFRIAFLVRLSPIAPYGVLNYALSLTPISQRSFALATLLAKSPGNLFYAFLGAGAKNTTNATTNHIKH